MNIVGHMFLISNRMGFLKLLKIDYHRFFRANEINGYRKSYSNTILLGINKNFSIFPSGLVNYGLNCYINVLLQV